MALLEETRHAARGTIAATDIVSGYRQRFSISKPCRVPRVAKISKLFTF
jgi:hypothetical protein